MQQVINHTKDRIEYIDTTKGILIIFLIFHHVINVAKDIVSIDYLRYISKIDVLYVPYFMQAFFLITGLCSNFNKPLRPFLLTNTKNLLIPLFSFAIINQFITWSLLGHDFFFVQVLGVKFFFITELYWFLSALFIAKMMLYAIRKFTSSTKLQFILVLIPFLLATSLNNSSFHSYNFFHWHNAFSMLIFMWIGYVFKERDILNVHGDKLWIPSLLFLIGIIFFILIEKQIPYYTHFPHYNWKYMLPFLFFASTGSMMILYIGKKMPRIQKLIFLGQNTIVVYGIHFSLLLFVTLLLSKLFLPTNYVLGLIYYLIIGITVLFLSYLSCILFQNRYFNYLIGKF